MKVTMRPATELPQIIMHRKVATICMKIHLCSRSIRYTPAYWLHGDPIRYTEKTISYTEPLLVTRKLLFVTRKRLFVTRLNKGNFKEIHIVNQSFSVNALFLYKICVLPHCFEYKKFPSNSIKVRREMWYAGRDSNPRPTGS